MRSLEEILPFYRDILDLPEVPLDNADGATIVGLSAGDPLVELLEAESPELRGTGPAFSSPGFSRTSTKYLPDLQMAISVAPRNVAGSW